MKRTAWTGTRHVIPAEAGTQLAGVGVCTAGAVGSDRLREEWIGGVMRSDCRVGNDRPIIGDQWGSYLFDSVGSTPPAHRCGATLALAMRTIVMRQFGV
jgi:hypothetical protein